MKQAYCDIFNECFPKFKMSLERFSSLINEENCITFEHIKDDKIIAFAIVEDYAIRLMCVLPEYQLNGVGKALLDQIEEYARDKHFERLITGGVSSKLFIGAVSETWGFFEKNGFESVGGCDEMLLELNDYSGSDYCLHGHDTAEYGWFSGSPEEIKSAVALVDESWIPYYNNPDIIYVARVNGEIASFCIVESDCQNYLTDMHGRVGMPGCVGTVPKYRNKGIALEMIANVTGYLKDKGMDVSFIFYTGVSRWYAKIGYKTFLTEVFGQKLL